MNVINNVNFFRQHSLEHTIDWGYRLAIHGLAIVHSDDQTRDGSRPPMVVVQSGGFSEIVVVRSARFRGVRFSPIKSVLFGRSC